MTTPQLSTRILMTKIKKIEEKLKKIFLRLDRLEQSVSAVVTRLNSVNRELSNAVRVLENKQNAEMYNIQYPDKEKE